MTTDVRSVFVDTNVLIYSQLTLVPQHSQAQSHLTTLASRGHKLCISRQVLREYISALSRPGLLSHSLPMDELAKDVALFTQSFSILEDGPSVTKLWLELLRQSSCAGRQVHDANIAATMLAHGVQTLLTHNVSDFRRFTPRIEILPLIV